MAGLQVPPNSVWSSMNYTPPRGSCNYKNGIMSASCPCLRFMLHPVKAATSFECDGCSHHASYHNLENPAEDAILAKWSAAHEKAMATRQASAPSSTRNKRKRLTSQPHDPAIMINDDSEATVTDVGAAEVLNNTRMTFSLFGQKNTNGNR